VLLCAEGLSNTEVSGRLHLTLQTVGKWRQRFIEKRIEGLMDEPRTGTPKRLTEKDVDRVLELTLESTPMNARRWSTRSLAEVAGLSRASVHRIWKAFSVEPHRVEAFRMMRDSLQDKRPGA
jgi:transposase